MAKLLNLIPANQKSQQKLAESFEDPLEGFPKEYKELLKKLQRSNDPAERTMLINKMNVIRKNIKLKPLTNEALEDMEVSLPSTMERFLNKTIDIIKSYKLPRKKEQLVIAKMVDALGMSPNELTQAVSKLKKYDIVHKEDIENNGHNYMGETVNKSTIKDFLKDFNNNPDILSSAASEANGYITIYLDGKDVHDEFLATLKLAKTKYKDKLKRINSGAEDILKFKVIK
jgi:arsenate reductase-like glutaredoxin family protein